MTTPDHAINADDLIVFQKLFERDISKNTKKAMSCDFRHFIKWYVTVNQEAFTFARLTSRDIIDYKKHCQEQLNHSPATINRRLVNIRSLCRLALELGKIKTDPSKGIKKIASQPLAPKGLSKTELRKLLKEVEIRGSLRDKLIIEILCGAGLRVSELVSLHVSDIQISERKGIAVIRRGKGNKKRSVPLNARIRELMTAYINKHKLKNHLLIGERGSLQNIAINKIVEKYAKKAGIKCSPHTLRHCFAYNYLNQNKGEIVGLSQLLGHSNINTTAIYTQHRLEDLQEKVEGVGY